MKIKYKIKLQTNKKKYIHKNKNPSFYSFNKLKDLTNN